MPQRKAPLKRLRADKKRWLRNKNAKDTLKKSLKQFQKLVVAKNAQEAKKALPKLFSLLDKAAKKNILTKNTVSRKKSRLSLKVNKIIE